MKPIKLHINKIGLVRDADIEITPLMVFSGESGLGKSYIAILCHYLFYVWLNPRRIHQLFLSHGHDFFKIQENLSDKAVILEITRSEFEEWLAEDAADYLRYMLGHTSLEADFSIKLPEDIDKKLVFNFEREMIGLDNNEDIYSIITVLNARYRFRKLGLNDESPFSYVLRFAMIQEIFGDFYALISEFVLPPSRGTFLMDSVQGTVGLTQSFIQGMKELENEPEIKETVSRELIDLFANVLDGSIEREGDKYIYRSHGDKMPISAAAASVREIAPMQLMIERRDISKSAVLIEEPESHLHPTKQRMMADVIAAMAYGGAYMQITTHSDYLLRRLNEYISLIKIKETKGEGVYKKACETVSINDALVFPVEKLSAYLLVAKEDHTTAVIRQDTASGVPFSTFTKAIDNSMKNSLYIDNVLEEDEYSE